MLAAMWMMVLLLAQELFEGPGRMVGVGRGSELSLYCVGSGGPTVVLESGFGGGTAETWRKLQPRLGRLRRTCSYDRAGYGFSTLGRNLPRDLKHMVRDLEVLLERSGEKGPYVLVGHSNGGRNVMEFARRNPKKVAGMVLLDAAVILSGDGGEKRKVLAPELERHLEELRGCVANGKCVEEKPDYWRAYLSEAEWNYRGDGKKVGKVRWDGYPVRVFVAVMGRKVWEERLERVCEVARDCKVARVETRNHLVHDEALELVVEVIGDMVTP